MRVLHLLSVVLGHLMVFTDGYKNSKDYSDKDLLSIITVLQASLVGLFDARFNNFTVQDFTQEGYDEYAFQQIRRSREYANIHLKFVSDALVAQGGTIPPRETFQFGDGNVRSFLAALDTNTRVASGIYVEISSMIKDKAFRKAMASIAAVYGREAGYVRNLLKLPPYTTPFITVLPIDGVYTLTRNTVPETSAEIASLPVEQLAFLYTTCAPLEVNGTREIIFNSAAINETSASGTPIYAKIYSGLDEIISPVTVLDHTAILKSIPANVTGEINIGLVTEGKGKRGGRLLTETANYEIRGDGSIRSTECVGIALREGRWIQ
ncbi:MAG: hypothetical protein M1823_003028 [Watsoniomyces obsoletus]|nr:MAG: hypothetical protein M1823_003028 [Watsoniomyces obsoletus]